MTGAPFDTVLSTLSASLAGLVGSAGDPITLLKLEMVIAFSFAGPTMYFFARRLNMEPRVAFVVGMVYLLFPFHILQAAIYTHLDQVLLMAIVPLQLAAVVEVLRETSIRSLGITSLLVAIVFPLYAEYAFAIATLVLLLAVGHAWGRGVNSRDSPAAVRRRFVWGPLLHNLGIVLLTGLVTTLLASFWLVPSVWELDEHVLLPERHRVSSVGLNPVLFVDRGGFVFRWFAPPEVLDPVSGAVTPAHGIYGGYFYLGVVGIALVLWAWSLQRLRPEMVHPRERVWYSTFLWGIPLGMALWTLADARVLARVVPFVGNLRSGYLFFLITCISFAVSTGFGFAILRRFLASRFERKPRPLNRLRRLATSIGRNSTALAVVVSLALFLDYSSSWQAFDHQFGTDLASRFQDPLPEPVSDRYRVANSRDTEPQYNLGILGGQRQLGSWVWWSGSRDFGSLYINDIQPRMIDGKDVRNLSIVLGVANVRYVVEFEPSRLADSILSDTTGSFSPVSNESTLKVFENSNWRPYVQVYQYCDPARFPSNAYFESLAESAARGEVIGGELCSAAGLPRAPPGLNGSNIDYSSGVERWAWAGDGTLEVDVNLSSASVVLVSEAYYPNWFARVDGSPAILAKAGNVFQGLFVDSGSHTIVLQYVPPGHHLASALVSLLTAAGLLVAAVVPSTWRNRCLLALQRLKGRTARSADR